jgi:hypothetical protein
MQAPIYPPMNFDQYAALERLVERIFASRCITRADQRIFMSLNSVNPQEQNLINRVYEGLHRGFLRVVD